MKASIRFINSMVSVATLLAAGQALASDEATPPRGIDIKPGASACAIGPFGQTRKAGEYNQLCAQLTDSEKCLALIKGQMSASGVLSPAERQDVANYCLENFRKELIKTEE